MSFADERRAIEGRLSDNYSSTPVKYEGVPFDQPKTSWVALSIINGSAQNMSIGTDRSLQRHTSIIQLDIFTPEKQGTQPARVLADTLAAVFRNAQFSAGSSGTITTRVPSFTSLGTSDGWYRGVLSVNYQRDVIE